MLAPLLGAAASQLSRALAAAAGWGERFAEMQSTSGAVVVPPHAEEAEPGTPALLYAPPGLAPGKREATRPARRRPCSTSTAASASPSSSSSSSSLSR